MKIVIDIPSVAYEQLMETQRLPRGLDAEYFICHGEPLDEVLETAERHGYYAGYSEAMREESE